MTREEFVQAIQTYHAATLSDQREKDLIAAMTAYVDSNAIPFNKASREEQLHEARELIVNTLVELLPKDEQTQNDLKDEYQKDLAQRSMHLTRNGIADIRGETHKQWNKWVDITEAWISGSGVANYLGAKRILPFSTQRTLMRDDNFPDRALEASEDEEDCEKFNAVLAYLMEQKVIEVNTSVGQEPGYKASTYIDPEVNEVTLMMLAILNDPKKLKDPRMMADTAEKIRKLVKYYRDPNYKPVAGESSTREPRKSFKEAIFSLSNKPKQKEVKAIDPQLIWQELHGKLKDIGDKAKANREEVGQRAHAEKHKI